jgi:hypothetical protein
MPQILSCDDGDNDDDDDRDTNDSLHVTFYLTRLQNADPSGCAV